MLYFPLSTINLKNLNLKVHTANLYKMRHLKIFSVDILVSSIYLACGTKTKIYKKDDLKIPQTFSFDGDTSFVKAPKTKTFFKDSLLLRLIDSVLINNPDLIIATQKIKFTKEICQKPEVCYCPL